MWVMMMEDKVTEVSIIRDDNACFTICDGKDFGVGK